MRALLLGATSKNFSNTPKYRSDLARNQSLLSRVMKKLERDEESMQLSLASLETFEGLAADFPSNPQNAQTLATAYWTIGEDLRSQKKYEESEEQIRKSIKMVQGMIERAPDAQPFYSQLGEQYAGFCGLLRDQQRNKEAVDAAVLSVKWQTRHLHLMSRRGL